MDLVIQSYFQVKTFSGPKCCFKQDSYLFAHIFLRVSQYIFSQLLIAVIFLIKPQLMNIVLIIGNVELWYPMFIVDNEDSAVIDVII